MTSWTKEVVTEKKLQVILIEIDALFCQLSQNITTDCAVFYTNLHNFFDVS